MHIRLTILCFAALAIACGGSTDPLRMTESSVIGTYRLVDTLDAFSVWHPVNAGTLTISSDHSYSWSIPMPNAVGIPSYSGQWDYLDAPVREGFPFTGWVNLHGDSGPENWSFYTSASYASIVEAPRGADYVARALAGPPAGGGAGVFAFAKQR